MHRLLLQSVNAFLIVIVHTVRVTLKFGIEVGANRKFGEKCGCVETASTKCPCGQVLHLLLDCLELVCCYLLL